MPVSVGWTRTPDTCQRKFEVLKNRLGIKSPKEMDDAEARALERTMLGLVGKYNERHRLTAAGIREIHKSWLGEIYEWAGEYREVNAHEYGELDHNRLHTVAREGVPELIRALEKILGKKKR
jgi:fido (protein-threonine AMPylation protein)